MKKVYASGNILLECILLCYLWISLYLNNASYHTVEVIFEYHFTWRMPATALLKLSLNITLPEQCQQLHCWSYLWISLYLNNASYHTVEVMFEYHFTWTMPATTLLKLFLNITLPEQCQLPHCWSYFWISLYLNNASYHTVEVIFEYHFTWTMPATTVLKLSLNNLIWYVSLFLIGWKIASISVWIKKKKPSKPRPLLEFLFVVTASTQSKLVGTNSSSH